MALIKCPNCEKPLSSTVKKCIHCGVPIRICPECQYVLTDDAEVCLNCGFALEEDSTPIAEAPSKIEKAPPRNKETPPVQKNIPDEEKDLQTILKEYQENDGDYKAKTKWTRILWWLIGVPFVFIFPIFEMGFVTLVRELGSVELAGALVRAFFELFSQASELFSELGGDFFSLIFDEMFWKIVGEIIKQIFKFCFNFEGGFFAVILSIINYVILLAVNGATVMAISSIRERRILYNKAKASKFNSDETLRRLKKDLESRSMKEDNILEEAANDPVWDYLLKDKDRKESITFVFFVISVFLTTLMPFVYAYTFSHLYSLGFQNPGVFCVITIIHFLAIPWVIYGFRDSYVQKSKQALFNSSEKDSSDIIFSNNDLQSVIKIYKKESKTYKIFNFTITISTVILCIFIFILMFALCLMFPINSFDKDIPKVAFTDVFLTGDIGSVFSYLSTALPYVDALTLLPLIPIIIIVLIFGFIIAVFIKRIVVFFGVKNKEYDISQTADNIRINENSPINTTTLSIVLASKYKGLLSVLVIKYLVIFGAILISLSCFSVFIAIMSDLPAPVMQNALKTVLGLAVAIQLIIGFVIVTSIIVSKKYRKRKKDFLDTYCTKK